MRPVEPGKNLLTKCNGPKAGMATTEESVSSQHGAVQRRARGCHVREQRWNRPGECLSVLRKMLQNMEKFTSSGQLGSLAGTGNARDVERVCACRQ